ncbi:hypothetical protein [Streptomyces sp. NPDC054940]
MRTDRPVSPTGEDAPGLRAGGPDTIGLAAFDWFECVPQVPSMP